MAVLTEPGTFHLDRVPTGTWYLLAQSVAEDPYDAGAGSDRHAGVLVATHGPLTFRPDTVIDVDLTLNPVNALDPPVLIALLETRKAALARAMSVEGLDAEEIGAPPEPVRRFESTRAA